MWISSLLETTGIILRNAQTKTHLKVGTFNAIELNNLIIFSAAYFIKDIEVFVGAFLVEI